MMDNAGDDKKLPQTISLLLRMGVILSVSLVTIGLLLAIAKGEARGLASVDWADKGAADFLRDLGSRLLRLESMAVIQLGIFIMILTPILRLIFALIGYLLEKDYLYTFISALVLFIIALSFFLGLKA